VSLRNFRRKKKFWIFSWAMSNICANYEYWSQVGATTGPENIVICYDIWNDLCRFL
jgi:hypothetical protein